MSQDDTLSMIQRANTTHNFIAKFNCAPIKLFISVQDKNSKIVSKLVPTRLGQSRISSGRQSVLPGRYRNLQNDGNATCYDVPLKMACTGQNMLDQILIMY